MSTPFLVAAKVGDLPAIELMLAENPARITEVDENGSTALLLR
jgi:ankyrin repeat protein